jgi:hypothetical protein
LRVAATKEWLQYFGKCYRFALHRRCGVLAHVSKIETRKKVEKLGKFKLKVLRFFEFDLRGAERASAKTV